MIIFWLQRHQVSSTFISITPLFFPELINPKPATPIELSILVTRYTRGHCTAYFLFTLINWVFVWSPRVLIKTIVITLTFLNLRIIDPGPATLWEVIILVKRYTRGHSIAYFPFYPHILGICLITKSSNLNGGNNVNIFEPKNYRSRTCVSVRIINIGYTILKRTAPFISLFSAYWVFVCF